MLAFDLVAASRWAGIRSAHPNAKTIDSQIAATAIAHGFTLVTRNVKDFAFQGLTVLNPWTK
jgi:predicted nucleic acid-binding protein